MDNKLMPWHENSYIIGWSTEHYILKRMMDTYHELYVKFDGKNNDKLTVPGSVKHDSVINNLIDICRNIDCILHNTVLREE